MNVGQEVPVLGLFREPEGVAQALDALRGAGFAGGDLEVLSGVPYPEGAFGEAPERHRLYVFPFVGAACGLAAGVLLTIATQIAYPVVTGGKPILSLPPMFNVIFEGTMLGAIIFTVAGILLESRLPDFDATPYDPRISEGYLGVLVRRAAERLDEAERALRDAGAVDVIRRHRERPDGQAPAESQSKDQAS
ncbi:MAG: DUF3341 domain-containing protein [Chloroflexota bacterium]